VPPRAPAPRRWTMPRLLAAVGVDARVAWSEGSLAQRRYGGLRASQRAGARRGSFWGRVAGWDIEWLAWECKRAHRAAVKRLRPDLPGRHGEAVSLNAAWARLRRHLRARGARSV